MNKFGGWIWVKGDKNGIFGWKMVGSREETQEEGSLFWCNSPGEPVASCPVQHPCFGSFRVLGADPDFSKMILLMYLTVVMISKPLETSNELDWTWFCESNQNFLKNVQEHVFFENSFFSKKRVGLRLFTVMMTFKSGYGWFTWTLAWVCFENGILLKSDKMRRT